MKISECTLFEDQEFVYHVSLNGEEIGITVAKSSNAAVKNMMYKYHSRHKEIHWKELKQMKWVAAIYPEDIKEIRKIGEKSKILWDWKSIRTKKGE